MNLHGHDDSEVKFTFRRESSSFHIDLYEKGSCEFQTVNLYLKSDTFVAMWLALAGAQDDEHPGKHVKANNA